MYGGVEVHNVKYRFLLRYSPQLVLHAFIFVANILKMHKRNYVILHNTDVNKREAKARISATKVHHKAKKMERNRAFNTRLIYKSGNKMCAKFGLSN
jgi:hypothetical protein